MKTPQNAGGMRIADVCRRHDDTSIAALPGAATRVVS